MVKAPALGAGDCEFEPRHPDILNVARGVIEALEIVTLSVRGQNPSGQIFGLILKR